MFLLLPPTPQGTPEFVTVAQCVHYFEWRTYAACKKNKYKPDKEVCLNSEVQLTLQDVCVCQLLVVCMQARARECVRPQCVGGGESVTGTFSSVGKVTCCLLCIFIYYLTFI